MGKPQRAATVSIEASESSSNCRAARIRCSISHCAGVVPVLGAEVAGEGAWRHRRVTGEGRDREGLAEPFERPGPGRVEAHHAGRRVDDGTVDVLRLTAIAVRRDDGPAGEPGRDPRRRDRRG